MDRSYNGMNPLEKYCKMFEALTGLPALKVKGMLDKEGVGLVVFTIDEYQAGVVEACRRALPFVMLGEIDQMTLTRTVSYHTRTLNRANERRTKAYIEPEKTEHLFTPGAVIPPIPAQVHVVAHGEGGDYRVTAVFTTKEKAEAYAVALNEKQREEQIKAGHLVWYKYYYDDTLDLDPSL